MPSSPRQLANRLKPTYDLAKAWLGPLLNIRVLVLVLGLALLFQWDSNRALRSLLTENVGVGGVAGTQTAAAVPTPAPELAPVVATDHRKGSENAQVTLVEYSDFECPYCKSFHVTLEQTLVSYGDKVALVYRHFPLRNIHPGAADKAEASECIAELGGNNAFWKYVDAIFGAAEDIPVAALPAQASAVGVDAGAFQSCLSSDKHLTRVSNDELSGEKLGVSGTPSSALIKKDGSYELIEGAVTSAVLRQKLDAALQ